MYCTWRNPPKVRNKNALVRLENKISCSLAIVCVQVLSDLHNNTSYRQAVIWNYDIFGFNAGRTRQMVDLLAASGFLVLLPDYFRGIAPVSTRIRYIRYISVLRIGIRIGSVFSQVNGSIWIRIRIQEGKNGPQKQKKIKKFHVLKCLVFSFES